MDGHFSLTALAVDIGGSGLRAARVDASGRPGPAERRSLSADLTTDDILLRLRDALSALDGNALDAALVVSAPGYVDEAGRVHFCNNLPGLNGVNFASTLAEVVPGRPVHTIPDLAAATIGEAVFGAGRGVERFLCTAIGTGVNAAMTVNGRLLETVAGCLGDAGHVLVEPDGPRCPCGGTGCLEAVASGLALTRDGAPHDLPDAAAVVAAARQGHAAAAAIVERAGVALGRAMATWCSMLWPHRIAVGGGVGLAGDLLLVPARRELRRVGVPYLTESVEIVTAQLGPDAGLIGAGVCAIDISKERS
jgi:glucokinase